MKTSRHLHGDGYVIVTPVEISAIASARASASSDDLALIVPADDSLISTLKDPEIAVPAGRSRTAATARAVECVVATKMSLLNTAATYRSEAPAARRHPRRVVSDINVYSRNVSLLSIDRAGSASTSRVTRGFDARLRRVARQLVAVVLLPALGARAHIRRAAAMDSSPVVVARPFHQCARAFNSSSTPEPADAPSSLYTIAPPMALGRRRADARQWNPVPLRAAVDPQPDPTGAATGDKTSVTDAAGTAAHRH